jgi:hypothetical protein
LAVGAIDMGMQLIASGVEAAVQGAPHARAGPLPLVLNSVTSAAAGGGSHWFAVVYEVLPSE